MRKRGETILECVVAFSLAIVLIPAVLPSPARELERLTALHERETARLIVEGELESAADSAELGDLPTGRTRLSTREWRSGARLAGLGLVRDVTERGALLEVTVRAEWRARARGPASFALTTWMARSRP